MTNDEYKAVLSAVKTALDDVQSKYPWCRITITGRVVHLRDTRAMRRLKRRGLQGDEWKALDHPDHINEIVAHMAEVV